MFESKYSEKDKKRWMEEFKNSGKSAQAYAKEVGIPAETMRYWLKKEMNKNYTNSFGAIKLVDNADDIGNAGNNETQIKYIGSKIKIVLEKGFDRDYLKQIVEVLSNDK